MASGTQPEIWITEVGIYRKATTTSGNRQPENESGDYITAAQMTRGLSCLLSDLPTETPTSASSRIKHFFYYQFRGTSAFDTGLIYRDINRASDTSPDPAATPYPGMYNVFQSEVDNNATNDPTCATL